MNKQNPIDPANTGSPSIVEPHKPLILVVEDYEPNILVAGTLLESFGYHFEVARNGHEAIEKVKEGLYALILMDVQMHGMSGLDTTKAIRNFERSAGCNPVPIIGLTAHAMVGDKENCMSSGMNDYISKPYNPDDLHKKIKNLLKHDDVGRAVTG